MAPPLAAAPFSGSDVPDPLVLEQENLIRREAEEKIQKEILNRILGEGRATVLVNVEVALESERKDSATSQGKVEDKKGLGDQDYILPWVPAPRTVNKANEVPKDAQIETASGEIASAAVRQTVKRFDVTVIHDDSVNAAALELVRDAISSAYVRFEKVLNVVFKKTQFAKYEVSEKIKEGFWDFLKPQYLLPGVIALLLFLFMFGPLLQFLRALLKAMTAPRQLSQETKMNAEGKNKEELDEESKREGEGALSAEEAAALKAQEEQMQKFVPFSYIDEKNIQRLIYLVSREAPETIAIVVSYLKPEHVKQVLTPLSPELQAKIAMHMAAVKQTSEAEVRALDKEIKEKIDYVVGGLHSLLKVLDDVDFKIRDNIMEYLKNQRPQLYEKVRRHVLMFEDLVNFSDAALQLVVRELRAETLARAMRDVSPALAEKIFNNMSKGAAALLKEEMEYSRPLSPDQMEEERQKIMAIVRKLEADGKINVREKVSEDYLDLDDIQFISGFQNSLSSSGPKPAAWAGAAAAEDPALAQQYVAAGAQFYAEGKYGDAQAYFEYAARLAPSSFEAQQYLGSAHYAQGRTAEALACFEKALALNPDDEALRQWVAQFRAAAAASA
jgi:flagellar motor switch protein FliG